MIPFSRYAQVKDHYCVCYFGPADEYLLQLGFLKPALERHYPGVRLFIGCRDDRRDVVRCADVVTRSELHDRRHDFAHVRELGFDGHRHPVEAFADESGLADYRVAAEPLREYGAKCVIVTRGCYPTKDLPRHVAAALRRTAEEERFEPEFDADTRGAGLVVGVESYALFEAAARGVRTRLVPTGLGARLYRNLFPNGEVLDKYRERTA